MNRRAVAGTYHGQWLRGVRHGYGIRQSVSYDLAVRYPTHNSPITTISIPIPGCPSPLLEKEDDLLLRERDFRIEESRGGFVLKARTSPLDHESSKHRMILDKHGKPSLRKTIAKVTRMPIHHTNWWDLTKRYATSALKLPNNARAYSWVQLSC